MLQSLFKISGFVSALLIATPAIATDTDPFVDHSALGTTDWTQGTIEATGQGSARYLGNRVQEELMAKQAARTMAQARRAGNRFNHP